MKNSMLRSSALLVSSFGLLLTGCRNNQVGQMAPIVDGNANASDPAAANLIPTQVAGVSYAATPQSSATNYAPQAAPAPGSSQQNEAYRYNTQPPAYADQQGYPDQQGDGNDYDQYAQLLDPGDQGATQPPPPLPVDYEQPEAPAPDSLWTPGYWDYANAGYYYVPGSWVSAPYAGALWTPGWWGYVGNRYRWHHGYWGRHVGYYGGINYGFGYIGYGYQGGYWNGDHFFYNRAVNRVTPRNVNNYVYNRNVTVTNREYINNSRAAYVGPGGLNRRPAPPEFAALREQRTPPMQAQIENRRAAEANRQQFFTANNGRPQMLYAAHALTADRNVVAPPRTMPANFNNNTRPGVENRGPGNAVLPANASPQQRQQFEQQRQQFQQQANAQQQMQQRQQQEQQRNVQQGAANQQRQQLEQQHQQATNVQQQQRVQQDQQRQQLQQRQQQEQQRQQVANVQQQQRQQQEQQRQLQTQQHQQADQQRQQAVQQQQQANAQRQQQQQANVQREQQAQQQRQQQQLQVQQRQQADQQRQQQANVQREQVQQQQRQQEQQRQVQAQQQQAQQQQRAQAEAQRQQQAQQQNAQRQQQAQQMQQQRQAQQPQHQQVMQARPAPAAPPRVEAPHEAGPHH